jgi:hypothetical protein
VWRWALSVELGLSQQQLSRLAAVLLVHQDMTAAEVSTAFGWGLAAHKEQRPYAN